MNLTKMSDLKPVAFDVLIVGSGHSGAQVAATLRQAKFDGTIGMVGEEQEWPYERPPLSKEYLSGARDFETLLIRPRAFWVENRIAMLTGRRVTAVDPNHHRVTCEDGETIAYSKLVWATGGQPRRLSCWGQELAGVHFVRTRADVDRLRSEIPAIKRAVVIGGGFIGLEAAAVLAKAGKRVVVLEALDRVLARVAGEPVSQFFEAEHRAHGVDVRLSVKVDRLEGRHGRIAGVRLASGDLLYCDVVIIGIGIIPAVAPLLAVGAEGGNGVLVDCQCRTSLADVFAIGDCALHPNRYADGALVRIESVQNANDQAGVVAKTIMGAAAAYDAIPWFWSNQYDIRLQTIGLSTGHDQIVVRGKPEDRSFSVIYLKRGQVIAVDCINATKDYVQGRRLVQERLVISPERLADAAIPLKEL